MPVDKEPESATLSLHGSSTSASAGDGRIARLHISPLDSDLLPLVIPASILPSARNVSYHTIETFPEKRYGFVELPHLEAEKIKRKLNGATLRGSKIRIETARPQAQFGANMESDEAEPRPKRSNSNSDKEGTKKRKRDRAVVDGVALKDRKVKRGWTEPADQKRKSKRDKSEKSQEKKKRQKSKYSETEECLLKTKVPPNAVGNVPKEERASKKKKKGKSRETTIHEFEKTTKFPSFLKQSGSTTKEPTAVEFVEGKGWVDEDGHVVEAVRPSSKPRAQPKRQAEKVAVAQESDGEEDGGSTSSSGTSSSGSSSDENSDSEPEATEAEQKTPTTHDVKDKGRPASSSSLRSLKIKIPPPITPSAGKVHPLEALYKRNADDAKAVSTPGQSQPFSFFGAGDVEEDGDVQESQPAVAMPMTPFTRQDFEWRNTRSAAPTPDTAHPSRVQSFWALQGNEDPADVAAVMAAVQEAAEEDETREEGDSDGVDGEEEGESSTRQKAGEKGTSEFQDWFWENRRDLNKSWMKRRKTAAKEKRHRENRARASRAV